MRLKAHAKINLSLRVLSKRPDGFHSIESVMQSVSLCDGITLSLCPSGIEVTSSDPALPSGKENLAYRAAELFLNGKAGVSIHIEKRIPMAAGLAGGSADAAAVIFGLNQLSDPGVQLSDVELLKLAARIGSDVPFCLTGGTCLVRGRGEIIEPLLPWPKTYFVLVCPDVSIQTKWAYAEFDRLGLNPGGEIKNDLEPIAISKYPVVSEIKAKLLKLGCAAAQMSGSGSSVFGTTRDQREAEKIFARIKDDYPRSFLVETAAKGVEMI